MAVKLCVDRKRRLVRTVWEGRIGRPDVASYHDTVLAPGALRGFDELVDARAITGADLPRQDFREMAKVAAGDQRDIKPLRRMEPAEAWMDGGPGGNHGP